MSWWISWRRASLVLFVSVLFSCMTALACLEAEAKPNQTQTTIDKTAIEILDRRALQFLDPSTEVEEIANGFAWTEGPLWLPKALAPAGEATGSLLFSDIPNSKVLRYIPDSGVTEYLQDSGFSNGLLLSQQNELILMQSRSRRVVRMSSPTSLPAPEYTTLASHFTPSASEHNKGMPNTALGQAKRLNSPNDGVIHQSGIIFFTDPPYGLSGQLEDPEKELDFQGVYALHLDGTLKLVDRGIRFPNGIALSPDHRRLYVAASDPDEPAWYEYRVDESGEVGPRRRFFQPPDYVKGSYYLPDGLKAHSCGPLFATGTGGVWLLDEKGTPLARIYTPNISANVALNEDESALYITAHTTLLRVALRTPQTCAEQ